MIRCHDCDLVHDVVGYDGWDPFMLHCIVTFWISLVLFRFRVSLTMTPYLYIADSVVGRITLTFLDTGSVGIVLRRVAGQSDVIAAGVERPVLKLLLLQLLGMLELVKGETKALLAETLCLDPAMFVPPTVREPRVVPPRGPPGAGVGTPPGDTDSSVASWRFVWSAQASPDSHCLQRTSPSMRKL